MTKREVEKWLREKYGEPTPEEVWMRTSPESETARELTKLAAKRTKRRKPGQAPALKPAA